MSMRPVQFPWLEMSKWDPKYALFKNWNPKEENIQTKRTKLNELFMKLIGYVPTQLSVIPDSFFQSFGPLDLMVESVLGAEGLFPKGQRPTQTDTPSVIRLTKKQVFALESMCFFGLLMNTKSKKYVSMLSNKEYTLCIVNYFMYAWENIPKKNLTWFDKPIIIERRVLNQTIKEPDWNSSKKKLQPIKIIEEKKGIEDFRNSAQVNFSDPVPGGTLPAAKAHIVQEEILFLIYPELFVTILLVPEMRSNEAVIVNGVTRTNNYTGYENSFKFAGTFTADSNDILIIFMDAVNEKSSLNTINRFEVNLNKAFLGFSADTHGLPIATGNWGSGAFRSDPYTMSVIQVLAAAQADRELNYTTFGNKLDGFREFCLRLVLSNATVSDIYLAAINKLDKAGNSNYYTEITNRILQVKNRAYIEKEFPKKSSSSGICTIF